MRAYDELATPLAWTDAAGIVSGCNPAFASWLGVSQRRVIGAALVSLDAEAGRIADLLERLPEDGAPLRARRLRLRAGGGGERFADALISGEADGMLLEIHPADEFPGEDPAHALPAALHAALKGLAHEFRNPLAGMKGATQLLARRAAQRLDNDDEREMIGVIGAEVDRLAALLERLVDPAPARAFEPTNIHGVLERVRMLADADAGWAIRLDRDYDPSLPEIAGDADRLTQALWNLLRNALESGANQVTLGTRAEHNVLIGQTTHRLAIRVEVSDDGRGVPDDLAERIFLPLVSGCADGSGLGLPLAQQIAREHGGALSYRSRPGHTVFTLMLPAAEADDAVE